MSIQWITLKCLKWGLGISSLVLALYIKHPLTFKIRGIETQLQITLLLLLISFTIYQSLKELQSTKKFIELSGFAFLILVNLMVFFNRETDFFFYKLKVLQTSELQLQRLGKHFIIGYTNYNEVKQLVEKGAIGGIYITTRNIKGKSYDEIQEEIYQLQEIQSRNNLPPLFITTDQEGGITSRLSPPLESLPPLSFLVDAYTKPAELLRQTRLHAGFQAQDMYRLGINLNLSPVVDLKIKDTVKKLDFHTQIYKRAISSNEQIVTDVGLEYCKSLEAYGVIPTLKHFPGLGRVFEDTHIKTGFLNQDLELLKKTDWKPFREISRQTGAFIMLGHVQLNELDSQYPASFSKKIIQNVIRNRWNHSGVLITDDLNMSPAYGNKLGIGKVVVKALNAGVDLLLFSYDGDQYYQAMAAIIKAENDKKLDQDMIQASSERLQKSLQKIAIKRVAVIKPEVIASIFL